MTSCRTLFDHSTKVINLNSVPTTKLRLNIRAIRKENGNMVKPTTQLTPSNPALSTTELIRSRHNSNKSHLKTLISQIKTQTKWLLSILQNSTILLYKLITNHWHSMALNQIDSIKTRSWIIELLHQKQAVIPMEWMELVIKFLMASMLSSALNKRSSRLAGARDSVSCQEVVQHHLSKSDQAICKGEVRDFWAPKRTTIA